MTPTDKLRALLDEMGVEWQDFDGEPTWMDSDGRMHYARYEFTFDGPTDELTVYHLTPEQAIAATVGVGTCKFNVVIDKDPSPRHRGNICECNKCGYRCAQGFIEDECFKCCPNCGRRITKEVTE